MKRIGSRQWRYHLACGPLYYVTNWGVGSEWTADKYQAHDFGSALAALQWRTMAVAKCVWVTMRVVVRWE